jgi:two-component system, OmpR family, aerobic respiration control sensor histidine kinase ArcB
MQILKPCLNIQSEMRQEVLHFSELTHCAVVFLSLDFNIVDYNHLAAKIHGWVNKSVINQSYLTWCQQHAVIAPFNLEHMDTLLQGQTVSNVRNSINSHDLVWEIVANTNTKLELYQFIMIGKELENTHDFCQSEPIYSELRNLSENLLGYDPGAKQSAGNYIADVYKYLEYIISKMPCYVYWKNKEFVYLGCNDATINDIVKLPSRQAIIGKTDYDFNWDGRRIKQIREVDEKIIREGKTSIVEDTIPMADGTVHTMLTHKIPIKDTKQQIIGILGISTDMTDTYLEQIVARLPCYVYWKDKDLHYLGCNDLTAELLNLPSSKAIIGKTDYDFGWPIEAVDIFRKKDKQILSTGEPMVDFEETIFKSGKPIRLLVNKMPLFDKNGSITGLVGISVDITELKQTQEQLRTALEQAKISDKAKTDFILNIEHDIRTPFSGIYGLSEYLVGETEGEIKELLQMIEKATKELLNYCNNILEYSRLQSGVTPLLDRKFDLKQLAEKVLIMEKPAAVHKQLDLYFEYDSKLPKLFISDEYRIQRILINLISNAIKFTKQGHVKLKIEQLKQKARRCIVQITVSDTGIGIPESQQTEIFERFIRLSPSNQNYYKGAGLGLTSVKNLLESLDGELELNSQVGKGSTFICTFPLRISLHDEAL